MVDMKNLKALAIHSAKGTTPTNFSSENVNDAFRGELSKLCGDYYEFMSNRYALYKLMTEVIDEIVPQKTIAELGMFAEIRTVGNGERAVFKRRIGKNRAKKFLTQVGINGLYESFRLDSEEFTVNAHAIGGAATIDFQRMIDGAETLSEYMDIVNEGLLEAVYYEVQRALIASFNAGQGTGSIKVGRAKTCVEANSFDAQSMTGIINVVKSYGNGAVIFATPEFVGEMENAVAIVPGTSNYAGIYHPQDMDDIRNTGFIKMFRGTPVVQLRQSYTDDTHEKTWLNPQYAFVLPTNGEKIVKIVFEGPTYVRDWNNPDGSMEIHVEKKLGVSILADHNWGIYRNIGITSNQENPYGFFSDEELGIN